MKDLKRENKRMFSLLLTFGVLVFGLGVPVLEINDTHVFNPDWTPHALIHEVWQLMTNSVLALLCLWWIWVEREIRLPSVIGMIITGSFLLAFALQESYGGSMKYLDGSEKTLLGVNVGVLGFGVVFTICAGVFLGLKPEPQEPIRREI